MMESIRARDDLFTPKDEDILQENVQRVQTLFLDLIDERMQSLNDQLYEKGQRALLAEEDRKQALVSLGQAWMEVDKANALLSSLNEKLHQSISNEHIHEMESKNLTKCLNLSEKEKEILKQKMETIKKDMEESQKKIKQLTEVNLAFCSNLKIEKKIQNRSKKENNLLEQARLSLEAELSVMQKKFDNAVQKKRELSNLLQTQQNETRVAQNVISRMSHEITKAADLREIQTQRWEDAMNAMNKRDTVLKSVVESRDKTKEALHETQLIQKSTQLDYSQLLEKYQRSQQELESQKKLLNQYHSQVNNLQSQLATAEENAKKSYEQKEELKQLLTKEEQISLNHKEKFAQTSILLDEARKKLKTKETINEQCVNAIVDCKLESKISEVVSKNKEQLKTFQDQLHSNAQLSNQLASLNLKYNELQEIHAGREKEFELLVSKHQETLQQLEKLISENQSLTYSLDKKEIELSTFKYRHQPKDTTELELNISSLEQNLKSAKKEKDDMVHNWLKLQQANTTLKKEVQRLTLENDFLQTQRTVHYTSQGMVNNEIKEMKKDSFEVNMQMTKLHVELERIRPRIKELEERNKMLETQLVNREYTSQDSQNHFGDMMHLLKSEIHRVTNDKLHLQKDQLQNGKSYCVLEQKYILKKELLEKLKKEKIGLLKQNQLFKFKIDMLTKKVKELKQDWKHLNELGVNHYNRQKDTMQKKIEGSFTEDYQVVDLPALKLRIETLTLENKHLLSQVDLAKSQAMTAEKKQLSLEKQIGSLNMQLHTLEKEASSLQSSFQDMAQRADWAEKICAFMESQFKEFAPNRKLDFSYLRNSVSEPSASLLSAFHSRSTYSTSLEELPPLKSSKKIEFIQQT